MKNYLVRDIQYHPSYQVLTLAPQQGHDRLQFWPGQYAAIGFRRGNRLSPMRCFSIVSSPYSEDLQFAMRRRGRFTTSLARLQPGQPVSVQGPFGNFVLDPGDRSVIMLAAGIGITPFMSMLRYAAEAKLTTPITLLYGCRSAEDIPFGDELFELQRQNPRLRVIFMVQQGRSDTSRGLYAGRIDDNLLQQVTGGRFQPHTFFICGPNRFSKQMRRMLVRNRVTDDRIVSEAFTQAGKLDWRAGTLSLPALTYAATAVVLAIGIGGIMALDLVRYVPRKAAALQTTKSAMATTPATAVPTPNTATDDASQAMITDDSNATTNSMATTPTPTYTQHYQPPMSMMS